jgi:hypothetical protein
VLFFASLFHRLLLENKPQAWSLQLLPKTKSSELTSSRASGQTPATFHLFTQMTGVLSPTWRRRPLQLALDSGIQVQVQVIPLELSLPNQCFNSNHRSCGSEYPPVRSSLAITEYGISNTRTERLEGGRKMVMSQHTLKNCLLFIPAPARVDCLLFIRAPARVDCCLLFIRAPARVDCLLFIRAPARVVIHLAHLLSRLLEPHSEILTS